MARERKDTVVTPVSLYKTVDGEIVKAGDPAAAFVYRVAGRRIPRALAAELGIEVSEEAAQEEQGAEELTQPTQVEQAPSLSELKVPQLKEVAAELGVEVPKKVKKADLIAEIEAAQEEQAAAGDGE